MDSEQNLIFQIIQNKFKKKIFYTSQFLDENTKLDIPDDTDIILLNQSFGNNHALQQYDLLKNQSLDKDHILLTSNYYFYKNKHSNILYFPYYYYFLLSLDMMKSYNLENTRPHNLMCLNLNPWLHRTINFLQMSKRKWFDQSKCSFHWTYNLNNFNTTNIGTDTLLFLSEKEKQELLLFKFPRIVENDWVLGGQHYVTNNSHLYKETYINYVTENCIGQEFITEKSWKPIFSGQLFYILGSPGIVSHLNDLGIDVFSDSLTHSYDFESDMHKKIDLILNV